MNLKTTTRLPAEGFEQDTKDTARVKLLGRRGENSTFLEAFGLDSMFYYNLSSNYSNNTIHEAEIGLAHLEVEDDIVYIVRDRPLFFRNMSGEVTDLIRPCIFTNTTVQNQSLQFLACAHVPSSVGELLAKDNCVIVSHEDFLPAAVQIEDNSILARVNGKLQSITFKELADRLNEYSK